MLKDAPAHWMGETVTFTQRPLYLPAATAQDHNSLVVQPTPWSLYRLRCPGSKKMVNCHQCAEDLYDFTAVLYRETELVCSLLTSI